MRKTWQEFLEDKGNVIVVTGEPPASRKAKIITALAQVEAGGWIMLANANRPEYARQREMLKSVAVDVKTFDDNANGSLFRVMEFYKMPGKAKKYESRNESEQGESGE